VTTERVSRQVLVPFGTRPEVVKLAPVVRALRAAGHEVVTVDTGQHTDPALAQAMQQDLGLVPDLRLRLPVDPAERPGALRTGADRVLGSIRPGLVLALGDTHTVPAYGLAARAAQIPFAHLEAGLRSLNPRSVEEVHRRVAGALAMLHLAPTDRAAAFLRAEGVPDDRIRVVGNPIVDALVERGAEPVPTQLRSGVLITAHRPTNVDDPVRLERLADLIVGLAEKIGPVTFPVHPRTADRLAATGLDRMLAEASDVVVCGPLPYDELRWELAGAKAVVTDSGGLQEEAAYYGVPVVVLRGSTPRWEGVEAGSTVLAPLAGDPSVALAAAVSFASPQRQAAIAALPCPYGDGRTGTLVAELLADPATDRLLELGEPDFSSGVLPW
jgi:UDP-N-acetylglucosamine 2-epimerase (non-hydrolysing)